MCEVWPGPRCSHDMLKKLQAREQAATAKAASCGENSPEHQIALARVEAAREEYYATPQGIRDLEDQLDFLPTPDVADKLNRARRTRTMQANALREIQNGRLAKIASLNHNLSPFYDSNEMESVVEASREYHERYALRHPDEDIEPVDENSYHRFTHSIEKNIREAQNGQITPLQQQALEDLRAMPAPDALNLRAYRFVPKAIDRSQKALRRELSAISSLQGVDRATAQAYYEGYRQQYLDNYVGKPELERPDPPAAWVRGEMGQSGYTRDPSSEFAPRDPASLYAAYRLRSDDEAIPDFLKTSRTIASIDLETAGPQDGTDRRGRNIGFSPEHGRIIEVGIVNYTPKGRKISSYQQFVKPEQAFLDQHGTGKESIHHISVADVADAPAWQKVAPAVQQHLEGKTLLAQNANFERDWLDHNIPGFKLAGHPYIDTLDISRKHLDLPNHQLATICGATGVEYSKDHGHRADHDALVTGDAYFELRKYIKKTWNAKPARRTAPSLTTIPLGSRWDTWRPLIPYKRG